MIMWPGGRIMLILTSTHCNSHGRARSKYVGVFWTGKERKWMAQITYGGRPNHLGYYPTQEKAALVYDAAVREHLPPGRGVNFPIPGAGEKKAKKRTMRTVSDLAAACPS